MSFHSHSLFFVRCREHLYWIFRRAGGGFFSGMVAWFFIPALSRVIAHQASPMVHFAITGLLGGAFLGTIDGMIEESSTKTFRGGLMGGVGGALGGVAFSLVSDSLGPERLLWGFALFWAIAGAMIGLVSAIWERSGKKIFFGLASGAVGGGIGGFIGYGVYANIVQQVNPQGWFLVRLSEGFSGGLIGVMLWFFIGAAERFVIFRRRRIEGKASKKCDYCGTQSPLNSWYCPDCGSVLQESAPPASLNLTPYATLDRIREMFRFLSRLAGTTGVIASGVVFVVLVPDNVTLAFVSMVMVSLLSYLCLVIFSSVAETIQIVIKK